MAVPEKLGDYLVRRRDPFPVGLSVVPAVVLWAYIWFTPTRWRGPYHLYWIAGLVAVCVVAALIKWANRIRCPKCGADLKAIAPKALAESYSGRCTQCGASFDDPY